MGDRTRRLTMGIIAYAFLSGVAVLLAALFLNESTGCLLTWTLLTWASSAMPNTSIAARAAVQFPLMFLPILLWWITRKSAWLWLQLVVVIFAWGLGFMMAFEAVRGLGY